MEEQKRSIVHSAIVKGLDSSAPLKDSGVQWFGKVPNHWEVSALRRHWRVIDCKHSTVEFVDDGVPVASVRQAQRFELDLSGAQKTTEDGYEYLISGGRKPGVGDLIYCRNVSVGACSLVSEDQKFAIGQDVCLVRSQGDNSRFLCYFLRSPAVRYQLNALLIGSTFSRINVADIKNLIVIRPSCDEQQGIAEYLDLKTKAIDVAVESARKEIDLLREYRARLIADVVTGRLDVREAAASLPGEGGEPAEMPLTDAILEEAGEADLGMDDLIEGVAE